MRPAWTKPKPKVPYPRHLEVLYAWWCGETCAQTAQRLGITKRTVESYRRSLREILNAPTMAIAAKRALRRRLLRRPLKSL